MKRILFPGSMRWILVAAVLIIPMAAKATPANTSSCTPGPSVWCAIVGDQNSGGANLGAYQAMAFLPGEMWINAGDKITWTSKSGENHTVTFLKQTNTGAGAANTVRPSNTFGTGGCNNIAPANQGGGSTYSSSGADTLTLISGATNCVNSGPICDPTLQLGNGPVKCTGWTTNSANPNLNSGTPQTQFTVTFNTPGNFKLVCLIHADMTGTIHVAPAGSAYPYTQAFYDDVARDQARSLIAEADQAGKDRDDYGDSSRHVVITPGETVANAGGKQYLAVMRFVPSTIHVHVGDTVEWVDTAASEPHTITLTGGVDANEPFSSGKQLGVVSESTLDADGDVEGTFPAAVTSSYVGVESLDGVTNNVTCTVALPCNAFNSGIFGPVAQEIGGRIQTGLGTDRVRITFTAPGTYDYFCILHDELGMRGTVVVDGGKK